MRPGLRRALILVCALLFLAGGAYSVLRNPDLISRADPKLLLPVFLLLVPLAVALNAAEFLLLTRLLDRRTSFSRALSTTIIGSAANLLPIPGSTLVRVAELRASGASLGGGVGVNVLAAGLWVGVALSYGGAFALLLGAAEVAILLAAAGVAALVASFSLGLSRTRHLDLLLKVAGLRLLLTVLASGRILLCLLALDEPAGFAEASVLSVAGVLGASVSIVPAGLGVREGVSALLAPLIGLPPTTVFLAVALNRLVELLVLAPAALAQLRLEGRGTAGESSA